MENQASSKSIILNNGLYLGVVSILISVVKYALDMQYTQEYWSGIASFIVMVVFIVMAIKAFKTKNGGFLKFGQAVKIGIGTALVGTVVSLLYITLFAFVIEPDFVNKTMEAQRVAYENWGMTPSQIDQSIEQGKKYFFVSLYGGAFIMSLFIGAVVSLIVGAIMKKTEEY